VQYFRKILFQAPFISMGPARIFLEGASHERVSIEHPPYYEPEELTDWLKD
jgi:hypothetical protein